MTGAWGWIAAAAVMLILAAVAGMAALCRAAGRPVPPLVCDDDGTGTCPCAVGDDIHRDGIPVAPGIDAEIDALIRSYYEGGSR